MLRKNLSTEHTEGTDGWELDGIFLGSLRLEILEEIFVEMLLRKKSIIGSSEFKRNLNGYFWVARAQEILEEIFVKEWPEARNNLSLSQHEHNL